MMLLTGTIEEETMTTTELVRADTLKIGDVIPVLEDRVTSALTYGEELTVITFDSHRGPRFVEVPREQLIRIVAR